MANPDEFEKGQVEVGECMKITWHRRELQLVADHPVEFDKILVEVGLQPNNMWSQREPTVNLWQRDMLERTGANYAALAKNQNQANYEVS